MLISFNITIFEVKPCVRGLLFRSSPLIRVFTKNIFCIECIRGTCPKSEKKLFQQNGNFFAERNVLYVQFSMEHLA